MTDKKEIQERFDYIMEDYHTSRVYTAPEDTGKKSIVLRRAWFDLWALFEPLIIEDYELDINTDNCKICNTFIDEDTQDWVFYMLSSKTFYMCKICNKELREMIEDV